MTSSPVFVLTSELVLITSTLRTDFTDCSSSSLELSNNAVLTFLIKSTPSLVCARFFSDVLRNPVSLFTSYRYTFHLQFLNLLYFSE